jgi:membrane-bound metal-dependent hydrolase YbcI (DUF457 family)
MLGHSHATSGALAWSGAAAALPLSLLTYPAIQAGHLGTVDLIMGTFLTSGAALLPDADHPDGTISHVLGPVSHIACRVISTVSGGHRHATHSLLFVAATAYGTWAGEHWLGRWFTLGLVFFLLALAVRALNICPPGHGFRSYTTIIVFAGAGTFAMNQWISDKPSWLPFAVGLGGLAHLIGDCLTDHGCPLLWPLSARFGVPIIDHTGNKLETWVLSPLFVAGTLAVLWSTIVAHP